MTTPPVVVARSVCRTYQVGTSAVGLWDATMQIELAEFVSVVGPSGSGKSTLMNLLGLLDTSSDGTLELFGTDVHEMSSRRHAAYRSAHIAFVFQAFHLAPKRSVRDNVAQGLMFCTSRKERSHRIDPALEHVGLSEREHQRVETLSGGERQRVAIARAIVKEPSFATRRRADRQPRSQKR